MTQAREIEDDPASLRSEVHVRFFDGVMRRQMRRAFRAVRVARPGPPDLPPDTPIIVYANHPSWWDPALFMVLREHLFPRRRGFGPMEAAALDRYRFMRRIGIFGIESGTRGGAARFLRVGERLLADPGCLLWLTAQGEFADPRTRPVVLRAGLSHLLRRVPGAVAVPLAVEYPFWSEKRPEALAAFGTPIAAGDGSTDALAPTLAAALERTQDDLAVLSSARDPGAFQTVLGGRSGIGGIYGGWSRARSLAGGQRHQPDHVPDGSFRADRAS